MQQEGTIPIVRIEKAEQDAYMLGYGKFHDMPPSTAEKFELEHYHSTSDYSHNVMPVLRQLAGFEDRHGTGTFQGERRVVVVEPEDRDESIIDADVVYSRYLLDELIGAFERGVFDAIGASAGETREH